MRIAIGELKQETNSFSPLPTTLTAFEEQYVRRGDELLTQFGDARVEIPAMLDTLRAAGAEPVPLLAAFAVARAALTRPTFDLLLGELLDRLRAALPVDGVLLALHGATAVEDDPDAEGAILAAVRAVVGPDLPIGVSLDLHGHITPRMVQHATFLIGYQEYPHIDMYETGERAARLLLATLAGERRPVTALARRPLLVNAVNGRTSDGPLHAVYLRARQMERDGEVLHASLFPVQPWLDVPDVGFAAVVVADGDRPAAQAAADELADMVWDRRAQFEPDLMTVEDAIRLGLDAPGGLTVVGDPGDAPSSGAAADNPTVLRTLLDMGADRASRPIYMTLCDPDAVRQAAEAGLSADVTLQVGHSFSRGDGEPLTVQGRVVGLGDGVCRLTGAGATGLTVQLGPTAVLAIGSIRLCLRSRPGMEWDPAVYTHVGLDPRDAGLIFVKSPSHFRVAYADLADRLVSADTPGAARANLRLLPFRRVTRPLYPLDE
ncbi:MAG: M81 family metallopeptidase [Anaerolineae bacterium]|nr:M81 family metallopeptidase [Anaerolineae bacterium]